MVKKLGISCALGVVAALAVAPGADAAVHHAKASWSGHVVQVSHQATRIKPNGSINVVLWNRCKPSFYTFEYSVDVRQASGSGSTFATGTALLPCDGKRHRSVVNVLPFEGHFSRGTATVSAYVGAYNPAEDQDLSANDSANVWLRPALAAR